MLELQRFRSHVLGNARRVWVYTPYGYRPDRELYPYIEIGLLENDLIGVSPSCHLRDVLRAKGYHVHYVEFYGGHDYACWRETLADGLIALLGAKQFDNLGNRGYSKQTASVE